MIQKLTKEQSGSLGGKSKWKKVTNKNKRTEIMRKVAEARWQKNYQ